MIETYHPHILVIDTEGVLLRSALRSFFMQKGYVFLTCSSAKELAILCKEISQEKDKRFLIESRAILSLSTHLHEDIGLKKVNYNDLFPNLSIDFLKTTLDEDLDILSLPIAKVFERQTAQQTRTLLHSVQKELVKAQLEKDKRHLLKLETQITNLKDIDYKNPRTWLDLVPLLSEIVLLRRKLNIGMPLKEWQAIEDNLNNAFQTFIHSTYKTLHNRNFIKQPFLVTRLLDFIDSVKSPKSALIVIDGMSYVQWQLIAEGLNQNKIAFTEGATYAWLPSITAWSRQAIFRGGEPDIYNKKTESALFKAYWQEKGRIDVAFQKVSFLKTETWNIPTSSVLGIVINDLDELMHTEKLGIEHLLSNTAFWLNKTQSILSLIKLLKEQGYTLFITSDHGNIEAHGIGNIDLSNRNLSVSRSKRHILFSDTVLKEKFLKNNPIQLLSEEELSVFLTQRDAFSPQDEQVITHGGSHFWEIVVPFIQI